ncbi:hypothetical protein NC796_17845 [Aliifodinibius sp. S!AR15-10]|uniref:hypothetical protein n=1 Tax=Aliifodinibius sp. S!AR15-10 TaxID=2950437 RepID=UPI0028671FFE|nr:hypothetical protein [Aliifodinibius sp. S!AR15-10]MDR8393024.1 hypothetical protein [Aliifodinibius sp. S!AR15-10]
MNINKLSSHINGEINETNAAKGGQEASDSAQGKSDGKVVDKVSIENYNSNNEKLFAKLELEKLNHGSSERLKDMKAKINEYKEAKKVSAEAAQQTEIGQKLNDPDVWGKIADDILGS